MKSSVMYCHWDDKWKRFCDFYSNPRGTACHAGNKIFKAKLTENQSNEESIYWAWWENEKNTFTLCYPMKAGVEICFPYGTKAESDRGRGVLVNVVVELVKE